MTKRYRLQVVADDGLTADAVPPVTDGTGRFHLLIIVEDAPTGDGREFTPGSLSWRDLPLPLMAQDWTDVAHMNAVLVGNIDKIEKQGTEVHGWGAYITDPGKEAARLIGLIQRGELRGVSADVDDIECEVLFPVDPLEESDDTVDEAVDVFDDPAADMPRETDENGQDWIVLGGPEPRLRVTEGRVMGATVVPFPAFQEAFIEPDSDQPAADAPVEEGEPPAIAAAAVLRRWNVTGAVLTAAGTALAEPDTRFQFPDIPPREWFEVPEADEPTPLTITDDGQVYGHLAIWGECHVGIHGECVEPPASTTNYARFHVGEIPVSDGGRVDVGRLTFATGHADMHLGADATRAHYDNTGTVGADVQASDGVHGIWLCGAARSTLTLAQVREIMASPPSGDWRRFGRALELVGALSVNVPGFNTVRARFRREEGLVASLIVSHPAPPLASRVTPDPSLRPVVERIAASIGRDAKTRIAALAARVHGAR